MNSRTRMFRKVNRIKDVCKSSHIRLLVTSAHLRKCKPTASVQEPFPYIPLRTVESEEANHHLGQAGTTNSRTPAIC